jgi:hypothetical protein
MSEFASFEELEKEIESIKDDFYCETHGKNIIFKNSQKYDCANKVVSKIPLETLLNHMCIIIENTNCVHIDYPFMKTFASPENFEIIVDYIIGKFYYMKAHFPIFEIALNLDGFSISAAERYKKLIEICFIRRSQRNPAFTPVVSQFVVYNSPTTIDFIKPLLHSIIDENMKNKLVIVPKKDSEQYNIRFSTSS